MSDLEARDKLDEAHNLARPWRNKFRSATEAIWGNGEITRGPGIWWGTHVFASKDEAELYGRGFVEEFPEWAERYGVEYLGAFQEP